MTHFPFWKYGAAFISIGFIYFYFIHLVVKFEGTLGKKLVGIKVKKIDGQKIDLKTALLRHSVEIALALISTFATIIIPMPIAGATNPIPSPFMFVMMVLSSLWFFAGIVTFLVSKQKRTHHDYIAGTFVIEREPILKDAQTAKVE